MNPIVKTMALDPSKGKSDKTGDYQALVKLAIDHKDMLYVQARMRRQPISQMVADCVDEYRKFQPHAFSVEGNAWQDLLQPDFAQEFKTQGILAPDVWLLNNSVIKTFRIRRIGGYLAHDRVRFMADCPDTQILIDQLLDFPCGDHDDGPDALEQAIRLAEQLTTGWQMIAEGNAMESAIGSVNRFLANFLESQVNLWDSYVDPREAYISNDGEIWEAIGGGVSPLEELPFRTTAELFQIQSVARILARDNEFAINAHANRQNYIIGTGHIYTVVGRSQAVPEAAIDRVQSVLDEILKVNNWGIRQAEIKLRDDRDGESFIRKFKTSDGIMRFRFVEPRQVQPPPNAKPWQSFGVETLEDDAETPVAYWIDERPVDASEIQHRKWNTDSSIRRGYPLLFPVRKNLVRASKLLRNMSMATEIQTAIALIRKHQQTTSAAVRTFINAKTETNRTGESVLKYPPGSILDASQGVDYTIPPQLDPTKTVAALQAELRSIAARLLMPEFMLSSDASNANFASTMVAEGPAVKNFEAQQQLTIEYDRALLMDALLHAVDSGLILSAGT